MEDLIVEDLVWRVAWGWLLIGIVGILVIVAAIRLIRGPRDGFALAALGGLMASVIASVIVWGLDMVEFDPGVPSKAIRQQAEQLSGAAVQKSIKRTFVTIAIPAESRMAMAEDMKNKLRFNSLSPKEVAVDTADGPERTEVRYYRSEDARAAEGIARIVSGSPTYIKGRPTVPVAQIDIYLARP